LFLVAPKYGGFVFILVAVVCDDSISFSIPPQIKKEFIIGQQISNGSAGLYII